MPAAEAGDDEDGWSGAEALRHMSLSQPCCSGTLLLLGPHSM